MTNDSFEQLFAAASDELGSAMAAVRSWDGASVPFDVFVCFALDGPWALGQLGLDAFGTQMSDTAPFGWMRLAAPTQVDGQVWLRLRVGVPGGAAEAFRPRLEVAVERVLRTLVGDAWMFVIARESDGTA